MKLLNQSAKVFRLLPQALAVRLFIMLFMGGGVTNGQTPHEEIIETVQTSAGELSLVRNKQNESSSIYIKLNNKVIAEKDGAEEGPYTSAGIYKVYPKVSPKYILVELTIGALICATKFILVDVTSSSQPKVTEGFGNCAYPQKVIYHNGALTITFPASPEKPDPAAYYIGPRQI